MRRIVGGAERAVGKYILNTSTLGGCAVAQTALVCVTELDTRPSYMYGLQHTVDPASETYEYSRSFENSPHAH